MALLSTLFRNYVKEQNPKARFEGIHNRAVWYTALVNFPGIKDVDVTFKIPIDEITSVNQFLNEVDSITIIKWIWVRGEEDTKRHLKNKFDKQN